MSLLTSARMHWPAIQRKSSQTTLFAYQLDPPMLATNLCHKNFAKALRWFFTGILGPIFVNY